MKNLVFSFFLFIFSLSTVFAYNSSKCSTFVKKAGTGNTGIGTMLLSTSSYISSTGECSMIGEASHDKKVFLAINLDQIQIDSARGEGEYLSAYASLSRCQGQAVNQFTKEIQKNFSKVFGENLSNESEQVYERMEEVIRNDPLLFSGCGGNV